MNNTPKPHTRLLGLVAALTAAAATQAAPVFTDTFDHPGNSLTDFQSAGWTTGDLGGGMGTGTTTQSGGAPETTLWGNNCSLEYNYTNAVNCGDILTIEANCMRFEGYSYLREIILWNGSDPASRTSVATLNAVGHALGPYATWWSPPAKDRIESLTYVATVADTGKYVIFKYGHSSGWGETADVTFSIMTVTTPLFTVQPVASMVRTEGESATLTASAIGCNVAYQWKKNGGNLSGKTDATLELTGLTTADSGSYSVTATSGAYSSNSTPCVLIVESKAGGSASVSVGVSFSHNYGGTPFAPAVTAEAYGVHPTRWSVTPTTASGSENYSAGAGQFGVSWNCNNTYWVGGIPGDLNPGNEQVNFAYLDDGGAGYSVQISGLTTSVGYKAYVVKAVAASDNATNFNTVTVTDDTTAATQSLAYGALMSARAGGSGRAAVSSTSSTLTNDSITLTSIRVPDTLTRGGLAGFIITDKPAILTQPIAPTGVVFNGEPFGLNAQAFGVSDLSYQWRKDGVAISGATTTSYSKSGSVVGDTGVYDLLVTNAYGTAVSISATVTVVSAIQPTVTQQPVARTAYMGHTATLSAVGYGGQLNYQWNKNGAPISGQNTTALKLTGLTAADDADYSVTVSNPAGTTNSVTVHLTVTTVPTSGYLGKVLADNPVTLWRLGEASGNAAYDMWGNNDGVYSGPFAVGSPGLIEGDVDTAVSLTPTSKSTIPFASSLNNPAGPFSVEFWALPTTAGQECIISSQKRTTGRAGFTIFMNNGGSGFSALLGNNAAGTVFVNGATTVRAGVKYHVVVTYDNTTAKVYVNGKLDASAAIPFDATGFEPNPEAPFQIGARNNGDQFGYNGVVDDVAVYSYALTQAQVQNHLLAGVPLRLAMTTATGIVADSKPSGIPYHGVNSGSTWLASSTDGTKTQTGVAQFNATNNNSITIPATPALESTVGTICFWVRYNVADNPGGGQEAAMILDRRSGNGTVIAINHGNAGWGQPADGTIFFQSGPSAANTFSSTANVGDGNWHHVAVTYDQSVGGAVVIYIDGNTDNSQANASAWSWDPARAWMLGNSPDAYWRKLHGSLDDFRIYNRILDAAEIGQIFNTAAMVDTAALKERLNFDSAPVSGYRLTTAPFNTAVQGSGDVGSGYTDMGFSPCLHIPSTGAQFFRARIP